jgi:predicted nucleic acid-binding protein
VPRILAAEAVGDELLEHLPGLARKRRLDLGLLLAVFSVLPIQWVEAAGYAAWEREARLGISARDIDDWPTVALGISEARSRAVAIWTQDKDFEVSGLPTITTGALLDVMEGRR